MGGLNIIKGNHAELVDVTLLSRTRFADSTIITSADQPDAPATAWSVDVYDLASNTPRSEVGYAASGDKADSGNPVVIATSTLQLDGYWDVDTTGYNIRLVVPYNATTGANGINWIPTHVYRVVLTIETDGTGGANLGTAKVVWEIAIDSVDP